MILAHPNFLWLFLLLPLLIWVHFLWRRRREIRFNWSVVEPVVRLQGRGNGWLPELPFWLRVLAFVLIILALARPQSITQEQEIHTEGIDIVLVLDISGSMQAMDFEPNRLEAAKIVARDFIDQRVSDRIGLVVFSSQSFTQCPMTTDYGILKALLEQVKMGVIDDGTAIGYSIGTAINRLKDSPASSQVIILLTDGDNNRGVDPLTVAQIAADRGYRIYTIGVGTRGMAPFPATDMFGRKTTRQYQVTINEELLQQVSQQTGGKYYRATDNETLAEIYDEINLLEKADISVEYFKLRQELFGKLLTLALLLLLADLLVGLTLARRLP
jgi:Ca-activated chloride channel homolog